MLYNPESIAVPCYIVFGWQFHIGKLRLALLVTLGATPVPKNHDGLSLGQTLVANLASVSRFRLTTPPTLSMAISYR